MDDLAQMEVLLMNRLYKKFFFLVPFLGMMLFNTDINATSRQPSDLWAHNVRHLIEIGAAGMDEESEDGTTVLMKAALKNHVEIIQMLIAAGAKINKVNRHGTTALVAAINGGCVEAVRELIRLGADVNTVDTETKSTPLICAARKGNVEIVRLLIVAGARINDEKEGGYTALGSVVAKYISASACKEDLEIVQELLKAGASERFINEAFDRAVQYQRIELMRLLIAAGADIHGNFCGRPLCTAAAYGRTGAVRELIRLGVRGINKKDHMGRTPSSEAVHYGHINVVATLLTAGASFEKIESSCYRNEISTQAIREILNSPFVEFCKNPDAYLAQPREQSVLNELLYYSALAGADTLVKKLLEHGADINTVKFNGQFVSRYDLSEVGLVSVQGESVLDKAIKSQDGKTIDLIVATNSNDKFIHLPYFDVQERHKLYRKYKAGCLTTLHSLCLDRLEKLVESAS
jgi:ankyrin repeat protein